MKLTRLLPTALAVLLPVAPAIPAEILELEQVREGSAAAPLVGGEGAVRFVLRVTATCGAEETLTALSVSVADSRQAVPPAGRDDAGRVDVVLEVPARQLKGVNRRLLCSDSIGTEGSLELLQGAFSANAAARCDDPERGSRTLYASTDVDVSYWCSGEDQSAEDQSGEEPPADN
ncbi:MAG: hypothetical protein P8172_06320 [Gammaproteobacteria bacterium]|jgi:hypothetical protein